MIEVNEPQVWTLIGVFGTALFGMLTLMSTMFVRTLRTEIGSLRTEMQAEFASVRTEIKYLDRDVQALSRRVFGDDAA